MVKTFGELYHEARRLLEKTEPDLAAFTARELLAFASERTVEQVLRDLGLYATDETQQRFSSVLEQYMEGKPLAYIFGSWPFFGLELTVTPDVLIPRDDTVTVTALALNKLREVKKPRVLDLCTGSGCIGIAIAANMPEARVTLADVSEAALGIAKKNILRHHLSSRVTAVQLNALEPAPAFIGKYDLIVSNPPYITEAEMRELDTSVRNFEPSLALCGGEDGLDFYRAICENYASALTPGGWLCFEFGKGQDGAVGEILKQNQFGELLYCRDTSDIIRAAAARKTERN